MCLKKRSLYNQQQAASCATHRDPDLFKIRSNKTAGRTINKVRPTRHTQEYAPAITPIKSAKKTRNKTQRKPHLDGAVQDAFARHADLLPRQPPHTQPVTRVRTRATARPA